MVKNLPASAASVRDGDSVPGSGRYPGERNGGPLQNSMMNVKQESEKVGLKLNVQKIKIMASGSITTQQIDGENLETVISWLQSPSAVILEPKK